MAEHDRFQVLRTFPMLCYLAARPVYFITAQSIIIIIKGNNNL